MVYIFAKNIFIGDDYKCHLVNFHGSLDLQNLLKVCFLKIKSTCCVDLQHAGLEGVKQLEILIIFIYPNSVRSENCQSVKVSAQCNCLKLHFSRQQSWVQVDSSFIL